MVIVAMFVTTKNPTMKTLMKVTMPMKTTMTTVLHRGSEDCLVMFSLSHCSILCVCKAFCGLHGVAASSLERLCIGFCSELPLLKNRISCCHLLVCQILPVSSFVHAHLTLLALEVALHDRSAIMFFATSNSIFRFLESL